MTFQVLVIKDSGDSVLLLPLGSLTLGKANRHMLTIFGSALERSMGKEIETSFLATTTTCQPCMWVIMEMEPQMTEVPCITIPDPTTELSCSQIPDPQEPFELIHIYYCFKPLSFWVICHTTIDNKDLSTSKCCGATMGTQDVGVSSKLESVWKTWMSLRRVLSARLKSFQ